MQALTYQETCIVSGSGTFTTNDFIGLGIIGINTILIGEYVAGPLGAVMLTGITVGGFLLLDANGMI